MNYTLNQLRIFLEVVKTNSVTASSEKLHITQPAVSIQLKNFQAQFDIPLYEVIGRKIYITDFGKEIADTAEQILMQVHAINYKTLSYKGIMVGKMKISVVSTGKYVMPYFLTDFMDIHPNVELDIDVTNKSLVINSLENNEVDFSLVSIMPKNLNIEYLDLIQNKLFLIGSTKFKRKNIKPKAKIFEEHPLLYREQGSATRNEMEKFIKTNKLHIYKKMELTSNEAVKQAVLAGMGYSIMPLIGIKHELKNGDLEIIPYKGLPIVSSWRLIWLSAKKKSPVFLAFLEFIRLEKARIIKENFDWYEKF